MSYIDKMSTSLVEICQTIAVRTHKWRPSVLESFFEHVREHGSFPSYVQSLFGNETVSSLFYSLTVEEGREIMDEIFISHLINVTAYSDTTDAFEYIHAAVKTSWTVQNNGRMISLPADYSRFCDFTDVMVNGSTVQWPSWAFEQNETDTRIDELLQNRTFHGFSTIFKQHGFSQTYFRVTNLFACEQIELSDETVEAYDFYLFHKVTGKPFFRDEYAIFIDNYGHPRYRVCVEDAIPYVNFNSKLAVSNPVWIVLVINVIFEGKLSIC